MVAPVLGQSSGSLHTQNLPSATKSGAGQTIFSCISSMEMPASSDHTGTPSFTALYTACAYVAACSRVMVAPVFGQSSGSLHTQNWPSATNSGAGQTIFSCVREMEMPASSDHTGTPVFTALYTAVAYLAACSRVMVAPVFGQSSGSLQTQNWPSATNNGAGQTICSCVREMEMPASSDQTGTPSFTALYT